MYIEDTKRVIRHRRRRRRTGATVARKKNDKRTNNDLQSTKQKNKDGVAQTPILS